VLCAGGIATPHLLMLSGVGPAAVLRAAGVDVLHDLPGVGHGFMDHPAVHLTYRAEAYTPRAGTLAASQVCLKYSSSAGEHDDMRIFPTTYSKGGMLFGMRGQSLRERARAASGVLRPLVAWQGIRGMSPRSLVHDVRHRGDLSLYCGLDLESSRGDITLRSSDPDEPPRIVSRYFSQPDDLARMRECVRMAVELLASPQFRRLGARTTGMEPHEVRQDRQLDEWIHRHVSTAFHTSRTCRMGPADDPFAVVDQQCRVHGLDGLRVVDVSIMPTLVRRGPNATAVMIGERAAALMDLSTQPPDPLPRPAETSDPRRTP
jgi:choline dehydrogenase-like flavoprotein